MSIQEIAAEDQCPRCFSKCVHGVCDCDAEICTDCYRRWNMEQEAEHEARFQREVMGPMLGLNDED